MNPDAIPDELKARDQWLLWDSSADTPRRPHWEGDFGISWSDPDEWHTFTDALEAAERRESWGIGYVTAKDNPDYPRGLYGVIDIDGGLVDGELADWVPALDRFRDALTYMERSPSGEGIHIPFVGHEVPEWWRDSQLDDHTGVDVLTNKFCTFTGDTLPGGGSDVADVDPTEWLFHAYKNIRGESPRLSADNVESAEYNDSDEFLDRDDIKDALNYIDPDVEYSTWRNIGFALHSFFDGSTDGKQLFEKWSRRGEKFDSSAERYINAIWESAESDGNVTIGTVIHHAKRGGWKVPTPAPNGGTVPDTAQPEKRGSSDSDVLDAPAIVNEAGYTFGTDDNEKQLGDLYHREIAHSMADLLAKVDNWHFRWSPTKGDEEPILWAYENGLWHQNGLTKLRIMSREVLGPLNTKELMNKVKHSFLGLRDMRKDPDEWGAPDKSIPVDNGLLYPLEHGIEGEAKTQLEPEHYAIRQLPTEYDPEAEYEDTLFMELMKENIRDETDLKRLQEYAGYTLWHHAQPEGKALFLLGPTDSGKSLFLDVLKGVLGSDNVASESMLNLMEQRWGVAQLYGKLANIRNEVTADALNNVERFKELTGGGDSVTAEYKGGRKFDFTVNQKFLFATNQIPSVKHADDAFFNRLMFVKFPDTVPERDQIKDADEQIIENEASAVLNWMIEGLQRLREQRHFTGERSIEDKKDISNSWGGLIDRFTHNVLEITGDARDVVHKGDLFDLFDAFATWAGREYDFTQQKFTSELKTNAGVGDGQTHRVTEGDNKERVYKGVQVKPEAIEELRKEVDLDPPSQAAADEDNEGDENGETGTQARFER